MKGVLSNNKTRRSSFDALDLQPEPQDHKSKKLFINICFLKVFIINVLMFIGIILFLIVLKNKKNEQSDLNLYVQETPNEIHIDRNYQKIMPNDENYVYVPIIGTNDIHGNFFPVTNEINYNNKNIKYKTGGLEYISKYINILKDEFGKDRVLYLDSGDNYFESYSAKYFDGTIIQDYFHLIGLNATNFGKS
jgi:2',3'-cyclic-nucleotide 2'-phosphodiesterase (5'-nucleotidase family)